MPADEPLVHVWLPQAYSFQGIRVLPEMSWPGILVLDQLPHQGRSLVVRRSHTSGSTTFWRTEIVGVLLCEGSDALVFPVEGRPWVISLPQGVSAADSRFGFSYIPIDLGIAEDPQQALDLLDRPAWAHTLVPGAEIRQGAERLPDATATQILTRAMDAARSAAEIRVGAEQAALEAVRTAVTAVAEPIGRRRFWGGPALNDAFDRLNLLAQGRPITARVLGGLTPEQDVAIGVALPVNDGCLLLSMNGDALHVQAELSWSGGPIFLPAPPSDGQWASPETAMRAMADPASYGGLLAKLTTTTTANPLADTPLKLAEVARQALVGPYMRATEAAGKAQTRPGGYVTTRTGPPRQPLSGRPTKPSIPHR